MKMQLLLLFFFTNHLFTGIVVTKFPGPAKPTKPIIMNNKMICQAYWTNERPIRQTPTIKAAKGYKILDPYLSNNFPIIGAVNELENCLAVWAKPKVDLPIFSSVPIGFINNPKFSDPIPIVAAVDIAMTITITQP